MLSFDPQNNSERDNYKLLTGTIIPRPIAFVTSLAKDGTINAAPFSYFNVVSSNPPMLSVSVQRKNGQIKDTARHIQEIKQFVVHIVDEDNVEEINKTAASLPKAESELDLTNLTLIDSEMINVPGIKEAKVRFECILERALELGDGESINTDLLIGKIVRFHVDEHIYEAGRINHDKLKAVSRLAGSNYAKTGALFSLERPK
ncbi:flavin reductase family protein [Oceanobacillus sp. FSL K6-2867]|uniref:flavin reductase family protein n=1 Tax=Oceanobacillus sp. FSL K6-2867 TaxID=2954748 RepID=UPI0030D799BB